MIVSINTFRENHRINNLTDFLELVDIHEMNPSADPFTITPEIESIAPQIGASPASIAGALEELGYYRSLSEARTLQASI